MYLTWRAGPLQFVWDAEETQIEASKFANDPAGSVHLAAEDNERSGPGRGPNSLRDGIVTFDESAGAHR
ncbi:hypothetical protein [Frankia gtarii]|uniref:hypothetical protein n=1 Tax=Frankia gtarii TaxID=2950102 RepID=UPI0021C196D7|nr:hypothetical protein [Frankia gtarii]